MDVENLFQKHTLVELKDVEKKLRTDVERKKEELRDLVSKRYRDLLTSADEIKGMHIAISSVTEQLKVYRTAEAAVVGHFTVRDRGLLPEASQQTASDAFHFFTRLLTLVPEIICRALDNNDPLSGALLFAVVRNLAWQQSAENPEYAEDPRWGFVRVYSDFISQNIQLQFEKTSYAPKELSGYFAANSVLNSSTTRLETLRAFLAVRSEVIRSLLTASSTLATRDTLRLTLVSILETLRGVREVLLHSDECGELLRQAGDTVRKNIFIETQHKKSAGKALSRIFDGVVSAVYQDELPGVQDAVDALRVWLDVTVMQEMTSYLPTVLNYVPSIQSISEISRTVAAVLSEENSRSPSLMKIEQDLQLSAGKVIELFHGAVRVRFSLLVGERTSRVLKEISRQLDVDESAGLSPINGKFVTSLSGVHATSDRSSTRIKFSGLKPGGRNEALPQHPGITNIASELTTLREEITQTKSGKDDISTGWMEEDAMKAFADMISALLPLLKTRLETISSPHQHQSIYRFMSDLAGQNIFSLADAVPGLADLVQRQLDSCIALVFSDWLYKMLEKWRISTTEALQKNHDYATWSLETAPFLRNIVEERNESGELVQYTVTVPCRASITCHAILQALHDSLVKFTAGRRVVPLSDADTRQIFSAIAQCYSDYLQGDLPPDTSKNQALQLIFDLKTVMALGKRRKAWPPGVVQTLQRLVDKVAGSVDPIDYHVLLPFLERHVGSHVASVQNLYFTLTFVEALSGSDAAASSSDTLKLDVSPHLVPGKALWFSSPPLNTAALSKT